MKNVTIDIIKTQLVRERSIEYPQVTGTEDVARILEGLLSRETEEVFGILCLDTKGNVSQLGYVSRGDLNTSIVHPRQFYLRAILANAAAVICFHNHPSGNISPSQEDIAVTKRLQQAGEILGIRLLDHIVIGDHCHLSFRRDGILQDPRGL